MTAEPENKEVFKIGLLVDYFGFLQAAESLPGVSYYYLAAEGTRDLEWANKFLPKEKILPYRIGKKYGFFHNYTTDKIVRDSNLTAVLKENNIQLLVPGFDCSKFVFSWAAKNQIKIASIEHRFQHFFENKIYFDRFLKANGFPKPKSFIYNRSQNQPLPFTGKFVLQAPRSRGGIGTFFLTSPKEIENLIGTKTLKPKTNYLLREFIVGRPCGISLFVGRDFLALSTARQQCFLGQDRYHNKVFRGVQWVGNKFSADIKKKINENFAKMGKILQKKGYFGFANFDFIIDTSENLFFIEFNPRLSSATPQIFLNPELISNLPLGQIFLEKFLGRRIFQPEIDFCPYPKSVFGGSLLEIIVQSPKEKQKCLIKNEYPNGIYHFDEGHFIFKTPDIREINHNNSEKLIIFYSDIKKGESYENNTAVFHLFSNFPLFQENGKVNKDGQEALGAFKY